MKKSIYIALLLIGCLSNIGAFSQIRYTDVIPDDTTDSWATYGFHFLKSHDSVGYGDSGSFNLWWHPVPEVVLNAIDVNCMALSDAGGFPYALNSGQPIQPTSSTWIHPAYAILNNNATTGNWIGKTDKYLGLKFKHKGKWYYGWARLDVAANASNFIIKDYACNTVAGQGINAGQILPSGIMVSHQKLFRYFLSKKNLRLDLKHSPNANYHIRIVNLFGQVFIDTHTSLSTIQLNLEHIFAGLYILSVDDGQQNSTVKLMLP